ncbi:MAG: hypothetical protein ALECFALPRED_009240 [Alectoria fallacina]|uniref:Uncharacterized protein n=1 Tax=Alectoria fallacina TaxID=1903189 RepID=A0A8H3PIG1_9LECA|nr:MAG: hypothetical protein ALECFALPRED_009240 [Alectoria fallacina]
MGCAGSRESSGPHSHHHHHHHHRDGDTEKRGHTPSRPPRGQHGRRWHQEDKEARAQQARDAAERERNRQALLHYGGAAADAEKVKVWKRYDEHVGRKRRRAEAQGREEVRDVAERERKRRALEGYDGQGDKGNRRGRREEIKVYASRDLKSHWSD